MFVLLIFALLTPAIFAVPRKLKPLVALLIVVACSVVFCFGAMTVLATDAPVSQTWGANVIFGDQTASMDALSALFCVLCSVAAIAVTIYSRGYVASYGKKKTSTHVSLHYVCLVLLYLSLLGVVTGYDAFTFLFSWEVMSITSFVLILFEGENPHVRKMAIGYLVFMHIAFILLVCGFVTISASGLPADFGSLAEYFTHYNPVPLFVVFLLGFGIKAGLFPLHVWLPGADPAAPSHVSALMSGVMVKMGVYGVIRVMSYLSGEWMTTGIVLMVCGVVTGLWGVVMATAQNDMRRMLAYSTMENVGVIFIALGAAAIGKATDNPVLTTCAMAGALLHIFNHAFFKILLFFGTGNIYTQTGTTSLDALGGVAKKMPVTAFMTFIAVLAVCALPPLSGFVSEFLVYFGMLDTIAQNDGSMLVSVCGIVVLSLIGGIAMLAFSKFYGVVFLGNPRTRVVASIRETDSWRIVGSAIPLALILLAGVYPEPFARVAFSVASDTAIIGNGEAYFDTISPSLSTITLCAVVLAGAVVFLALARWMLMRKRPVESSPTWGCGYGAPNSAMQYTGESFSEGLRLLAGSMTKSSEKGAAVDKNEIFPASHRYSVSREDKVDSFVTRWWVEIIRIINVRVMKIRTGKVNHYILYALMFLVLVFLLSVIDVI